MKYLSRHSDWLFINVGANVGKYSLYAAKLDRKVLAVEQRIDSIYRLHKAVKLEGIVESNIVLLHNAISNKRNELQMENGNVETILFDDIVPFLPKRIGGHDFRRAMLKIDIDGHEPFAFLNATDLFARLDIRVIFMAWRELIQKRDARVQVVQMMFFLHARNFTAHRLEEFSELNSADFLKWPALIVWIKSSNDLIEYSCASYIKSNLISSGLIVIINLTLGKQHLL